MHVHPLLDRIGCVFHKLGREDSRGLYKSSPCMVKGPSGWRLRAVPRLFRYGKSLGVQEGRRNRMIKAAVSIVSLMVPIALTMQISPAMAVQPMTQQTAASPQAKPKGQVPPPGQIQPSGQAGQQ